MTGASSRPERTWSWFPPPVIPPTPLPMGAARSRRSHGRPRRLLCVSQRAVSRPRQDADLPSTGNDPVRRAGGGYPMAGHLVDTSSRTAPRARPRRGTRHRVRSLLRTHRALAGAQPTKPGAEVRGTGPSLPTSRRPWLRSTTTRRTSLPSTTSSSPTAGAPRRVLGFGLERKPGAARAAGIDIEAWPTAVRDKVLANDSPGA